jgi:hypothetical protein
MNKEKSMMKNYSKDFFKKRHQRTLYSAQIIISYLFEMVTNITSAIDVGCGVGTWLSVMKNKGVKEIFGIDGDWIDKSLLVIPQECFLSADLSKPIEIDRRYNLAISLEVAEHLPEESARTFVNSLVDLSDIIMFSAAIPGQEARDHINEQWPEYWVNHFIDFEYEVVDALRTKFWNDEKVLLWYRQNLLLFVKKTRISEFSLLQKEYEMSRRAPLSIVHPELFEKKTKKLTSLKGSWKAFRRSLKSEIKKGLA